MYMKERRKEISDRSDGTSDPTRGRRWIQRTEAVTPWTNKKAEEQALSRETDTVYDISKYGVFRLPNFGQCLRFTRLC